MIPSCNELYFPCLKRLSLGPANMAQLLDYIQESLGLSSEVMETRTKNGNSTVIRDRLNWSLVYFRKAELINSKSWGVSAITDKGIEFLNEHPLGFSKQDLESENESFRKFSEKRKNPTPNREPISNLIALQDAQTVYDNYLIDVLNRILNSTSASKFDSIVEDVARQMGYDVVMVNSASLTAYEQLGTIHSDKTFVLAIKGSEPVIRARIENYVSRLNELGVKDLALFSSATYRKDMQSLSNDYPNMDIHLIDGKQIAKELLLSKNSTTEVGVESVKIKRIEESFFID